VASFALKAKSRKFSAREGIYWLQAPLASSRHAYVEVRFKKRGIGSYRDCVAMLSISEAESVYAAHPRPVLCDSKSEYHLIPPSGRSGPAMKSRDLV
jgi:hypothetical protein